MGISRKGMAAYAKTQVSGKWNACNGSVKASFCWVSGGVRGRKGMAR